MSEAMKVIFNDFQDYLSSEQELREEIRSTVRDIDKHARDMTMILQNIHNDLSDENIIVSEYCFKARAIFEEVRQLYSKLAGIIPSDQYYRYHDQWKWVTQKLCFLASLIVYLEVRILISKETAASILGVKNNSKEGFHLDLEDFLMGLLQLAGELSRFAVNSVTNGNYNRPIEISQFVNEMNAGFRLLNLKNDGLRKRYDALKYDVKKIEEVVYDLSIRGLKPTEHTEEKPAENEEPATDK